MPLDAFAQLRLPQRHGQGVGQLRGRLLLVGRERVAVWSVDTQPANQLRVRHQRQVDAGLRPAGHPRPRRDGGGGVVLTVGAGARVKRGTDAGDQLVPVVRLCADVAMRRDHGAAPGGSVEHRDVRGDRRDQVADVLHRRLRDTLRRARSENAEMRVVEGLQPAVVPAQSIFGVLALGDVALDAEVPGDAPVRIIEAQVVAFDLHRRAVGTPLVGFDVQPPAVEELPPDTAAGARDRA